MGRPPIGERAMTAAERKLRWREAHRGAKPGAERNGTKPEGTKQGTKADEGEADALRRENAELRAQVDALRPERGEAKAPEAGGNEALRRELEELRARVAAFPKDRGFQVVWETLRTQKKEVDRLTKELAAARAAHGLGADAEAAVGRLTRERDAAREKLEKAEAKLADPDGEIGKLQGKLKAERVRVRVLADALDKARIANPASIAKRDWRKLQKVFHPDGQASEKARTEAAQIFNALKLNVVDDGA